MLTIAGTVVLGLPFFLHVSTRDPVHPKLLASEQALEHVPAEAAVQLSSDADCLCLRGVLIVRLVLQPADGTTKCYTCNIYVDDLTKHCRICNKVTALSLLLL